MPMSGFPEVPWRPQKYFENESTFTVVFEEEKPGLTEFTRS